MTQIKDSDIKYINNMGEDELEDYLAQLDEFEKDGMDVADFRAAAIHSQSRFSDLWWEDFEQEENEISLAKLKSCEVTPRDLESSFFKEITANIWRFSKLISGGWKQKYQNAPIVYGALVQAWDQMREPGEGSGAMVVVFATDSHKDDANRLAEVASKVQDLRDWKSNIQITDDTKQLIADLEDHQSIFCHKLNSNIVWNAEAWCCVVFIDDQKDLPKWFIPDEEIIPFLLIGNVKEDYSPDLVLVPSKYYT